MLAGDSFICCVNWYTNLIVHRLQRLMLILLMLHYLVELSFHLSRILHYHQKKEIASMGLAFVLTAGNEILHLFV